MISRPAARLVPLRADVASQVLTVIEDPDAGAADVAHEVNRDPGLAARTIAVANSAFYGLSTRVANTRFAVAVLGLGTMRALTLTAATGLDRAEAVPNGFWWQAATTAAAADALAPVFGVPGPDAMCLGLLHTLGSALLHQRSPLPALCLPTPEDPHAGIQEEVDLYGTDHATAGAEALSAWRFPDHMCAVIAAHHDDVLPDAYPASRLLHAARIITDVLIRAAPPTDAPRVSGPSENVTSGASIDAIVEAELQRISEGRLDPGRNHLLLQRIRANAAGLHCGLTS